MTYTKLCRFNDAIRVLRERHLVDRHQAGTPDVFLTTHRALQRRLLHSLDRDLDERAKVFQQALNIARAAFPRQNIALRGDTSLFPINKKYLPHVASIRAAFLESNPPMANNVLLAELIKDAAAFLFNWQVRGEALELLATAEKMCSEMIDEDPERIGTILATITSDLGIYDQYFGVGTRQRGIDRTRRALKLQKDHIARIPEDEVTTSDRIFLGRFHIDHGCCWMQTNSMSEADALFRDGLIEYGRGGGEEKLAARYGLVYIFQAMIETTRRNVKEADRLSAQGIALMERALDPNAHSTLWCKFLVGMVLFCSGKIELALKCHTEVLESRLKDLGKEHHETLSSQYCLAVVQEQMGDLEAAE